VPIGQNQHPEDIWEIGTADQLALVLSTD